MGADLICYIAFGPRQIHMTARKATQVARQVRQYLDACVEAAEESILGRKQVPSPRKRSIEAKRSMTLQLELEKKPGLPRFETVEQLRSHPGYRDIIQDVLTDSGYGVEAKHVFAGTLKELAKEVQEFIDGWNSGEFRDMSSREDPDNECDNDRKVVVAGEMSWGDEPDGLGYQLLKKAFGLGIAQLLGVQ